MFKVLYVEDHPAQQDILAQMIELNGYEVAVASDGIEGVEKTREWLPDLILMDVRMPRMDGFEAMRIIRSDEKIADIPIIVVSAWASEKHKEHTLRAGANEHFTKPVDLNRLLTTINRYLKSGDSKAKLKEQHKITLLTAEIEALYAEKMELAYKLRVWQHYPELAFTLEQFTKLTSGLAHDLRNRLGILKEYRPQVIHCLWFLESLAFLRFKPLLSRQSHSTLEIFGKDLGEYSFGEFVVSINSQEKKENLSSITVNGLIDTQILSRGLWLLFLSLARRLSKGSPGTISPQDCVIEIEDKCPNQSKHSFYFTISIPSKSDFILPQNIDLQNVLSGDEIVLSLFILHKAVFLNGGVLSIHEKNQIEIKGPVVSSEETNLQNLQLSIDKLTKDISVLAKQYNGFEPNITPLIKGFVAAISQMLDNLAIEAKNETNEKTQKIILRNCKYAQLLLQNLLWLGAGIELPKEKVYVGDVLESVLELMRGEIRTEVRLDFQPDLPPVWANRVSLQQVFMNLITNAVEAMSKKGLLTLRTLQSGSEVYIEVGDTGSGISTENLERIFDLAFSTKEGHERGTGLYIVKSIIDKLGGKVKVKSESKIGTTFSICLPGC